MKFDFWAFVINKSHVAIACIAQGWVMWENHHGHDISANVAQTLNWFYLFLAGHFGASQVWPDKDADHDGIPDNQEAHGDLGKQDANQSK